MRKKLETDQTQRHKDDHLGRRKRRRGFLLARRGHCRQPPQMAYRRFRLQPCSAFLTASCPPSPFHNPQPSCVSLSSLSLWHTCGRFFFALRLCQGHRKQCNCKDAEHFGHMHHMMPWTTPGPSGLRLSTWKHSITSVSW